MYYCLVYFVCLCFYLKTRASKLDFNSRKFCESSFKSTPFTDSILSGTVHVCLLTLQEQGLLHFEADLKSMRSTMRALEEELGTALVSQLSSQDQEEVGNI